MPQMLNQQQAVRELRRQFQSPVPDDPGQWRDFEAVMTLPKSGIFKFQIKHRGRKEQIIFRVQDPVTEPFQVKLTRKFDPVLVYPTFTFDYKDQTGMDIRKIFRIRRDDLRNPLLDEETPVEAFRSFKRLVFEKGTAAAAASLQQQLESEDPNSDDWEPFEARMFTAQSGLVLNRFRQNRKLSFGFPARTPIAFVRT